MDAHHNDAIVVPTGITVKGITQLLVATANPHKKMISLGIGDPTSHSCFRTSSAAKEAVIRALNSDKFNGYAPAAGLPQARKAIAEYLSSNLPYTLSPDDVYLMSGCQQAIQTVLSSFAVPGANVLLPSTNYPLYGLCASFRHLEVRHYDLLPNNGWEVDLQAVENLSDRNTVAIVITNPGNPCGNIYSYQHLKDIAETAKRVGNIAVIADEVYAHLAFGPNPFVPMGTFAHICPVLTLGSLSKRWLVPGWHLGWLVTNDPDSKWKSSKFVEYVKKYTYLGGRPATFIQAAVPVIIKDTKEVFFKETLQLLKQGCDALYEKIKGIPWVTCPSKPEGSIMCMVKLNISKLKDINNDNDFCFKLSKEESVIVIPGQALGLKNWIRITFAVERSTLEEGLERMKSFCQRHSLQIN